MCPIRVSKAAVAQLADTAPSPGAFGWREMPVTAPSPLLEHLQPGHCDFAAVSAAEGLDTARCVFCGHVILVMW